MKDADWQELLRWILRKRRRFRVSGNSMLPLLKPGDEVLVDLDAYRHAEPVVGDIVIAVHPQRPHLNVIKRVTGVDPEGACFLEGDNSRESTDSRIFGAVVRDSILGRITSRFS